MNVLRPWLIAALLVAPAACSQKATGDRAPQPAAKPAATEPAAAKPAPAAFDPRQIPTWPRMHADAFGCMLEKTFGQRDARFHCGLKDYHPAGDPCRDTDRYYEGPGFPEAGLAAIDPRLDSVRLSWEHGELQAVTLTFRTAVPVAELARRFGLPPLDENPEGEELARASYPKSRPNISSISIQRCGSQATCLSLEGFEHMGAGELDCP